MWKDLIGWVRSAKSKDLNQVLAVAPPALRNQFVALLQGIKDSWCEEVSAKWLFWSQLPHAALGLWPPGRESPSIAARLLALWEEVRSAGHVSKAHRVTRRLLDPAA
eukprot:10545889-Alexandrium_andersonii.AAC.1